MLRFEREEWPREAADELLCNSQFDYFQAKCFIRFGHSRWLLSRIADYIFKSAGQNAALPSFQGASWPRSLIMPDGQYEENPRLWALHERAKSQQDETRDPAQPGVSFVSIYISTRNSEGCIGYTIENLLNQL
jgi:hypothetical protein